jgi:hypothetical protein
MVKIVDQLSTMPNNGCTRTLVSNQEKRKKILLMLNPQLSGL